MGWIIDLLAHGATQSLLAALALLGVGYAGGQAAGRARVRADVRKWVWAELPNIDAELSLDPPGR
ncbi:MAG: hypothetical protein GY788_22100 [bacterium]|nr:hypothetical protein [bacterium]